MTDYHDYLIILSPSESITGRVKKLKDFTAGIIGEFESRHSTAHITVQPWFRKRSAWIDPILPKLERDMQSLSPLILDINGFDFFSHQDHYTIYAKLNSSPLTSAWLKQLRKFFNVNNLVPHITIAKSIPAASFNKLWPSFKNSEWNEQCTIDKLTILRRETIGYHRSYRIYKQISFNRNIDFYAFANSKLKITQSPISHPINQQQISLF